MQIRQPGSLSGLLSGLQGFPASPFGHHLCLRLPYCANQNSLSPLEARQNLSFSLLFPSVSRRLRDALLIFPSVGLVYISGGKLKYDSFSSWRVITMKHIWISHNVRSVYCDCIPLSFISNGDGRPINLMPPIQIVMTGMQLGERCKLHTGLSFVDLCNGLSDGWRERSFILWVLSLLFTAVIESDEAWI